MNFQELSEENNHITDQTRKALNDVNKDLKNILLDLLAISTGISAAANQIKADDNANLLDFLSKNLTQRSEQISNIQDAISIFLSSTHISKEDASKSLQGVTDIESYLDDKMDAFEETTKHALAGSNTTVNGQVQPPSYNWRELARLANEIAVAEDIEYNRED